MALEYDKKTYDVSIELQREGEIIRIPLEMKPYIKLTKDESLNMLKCKEAHNENAKAIDYNKKLAGLLTDFLKKNKCAISAGKITIPEAPPDFVKERRERIEEIESQRDKVQFECLKYLAMNQKILGKDFTLENMREEADKLAYELEKKEGKIRVQPEDGLPPSFWSGKEDEPDSLGRKVVWAADKNHTFYNPQVRPLVMRLRQIEEGKQNQLVTYMNSRIAWVN